MSITCKQPVSVLVVIHTPDLQILLIERTAHPGYWQSVTGSREDEESLVGTACREVGEETGLVIAGNDLSDWRRCNRYEIYPLWRHRYAPGIIHNEEHVFSLQVAEAQPVQLAPAEHRAQCWLPWRAAAARCFSPSNRAAILELPARLGLYAG
jgi:dihydroneopterin triphosphate diphosphatase